LPDLIVKDGDTFRLDPEWQPETIEYDSYTEAGMPIDESSVSLERSGNSYMSSEGKLVSEALVNDLLDTISSLHLSHGLVYARTSYDGPHVVPIFNTTTLKLIGKDGNRVIVTVWRIENGAAVWNVVYNGRVYAQYDESLSLPVSRLIPAAMTCTETSCPAVHTVPSSMDITDYHEMPATIEYGFSGFDDDKVNFSYITDPAAWALNGLLSPDGYGYSADQHISQIKLMKPQGDVKCNVVGGWTQDRMRWGWTSVEWNFTCPVAGMHIGDWYHIPMEIDYESGKTDQVTLSGQWGKRPEISFDLSEEADRLFGGYIIYDDLLNDHQLNALSYEEFKVDTTTGAVIDMTGAL
jgi:hypothetical protein